jgi:cystathionine beta-lyase/cystathionine gamma-synthase
VVTPIFQSANYLMAGETDYGSVRYVRLGNSPSHEALQSRLAAVEEAEAALVTASGMAAITSTVLTFASAGDHLLTQRTLYGGTQSFLYRDAARLGIGYTAIDPSDPDSWQGALQPTTRLVLVESISNPLMEVGDLRALIEFSRRNDLLTVIDNTFATPVNFRPLELGFDLVVHSATKYLAGHSDIAAGVVAGGQVKIDRVREVAGHLGGCLDPHACFLLERGLKTLVLRVERQSGNAMKLARFFAGHPCARRVNYPGLAGAPGHEHARELFSGFGGMLSVFLEDAARAERMLAKMTVALHAASLGGVETLAVRPSHSSHLGQTQEERERLGITDELVRISVGIEGVEDLIADFEQALEG